MTTRAPDHQRLGQPTASPFERLVVGPPVHRIAFIKERCAGRRVLDVGALDETEFDRPQHSSWRWLHREIAEVAKEVLGVDASPKLRGGAGLVTSFGTRIVHGTVDDMDETLRTFRPELIVAGEVIEHTPNTLAWLSRIGEVIPGTRVLLTTPNATSFINLALALVRRENAHEDHLHIYSYKTLAALSRRLHMTDAQIHPYFYDPQLFLPKIAPALHPLVRALDVLVLRPVQVAAPLTAFGLILEGTLGSTKVPGR